MPIKVELENCGSIEFTPSEEQQSQLDNMDLLSRMKLERKIKTMLNLDLGSVVMTIGNAHRQATIDSRCKLSFQEPVR